MFKGFMKKFFFFPFFLFFINQFVVVVAVTVIVAIVVVVDHNVHWVYLAVSSVCLGPLNMTVLPTRFDLFVFHSVRGIYRAFSSIHVCVQSVKFT